MRMHLTLGSTYSLIYFDVWKNDRNFTAMGSTSLLACPKLLQLNNVSKDLKDQAFYCCVLMHANAL